METRVLQPTPEAIEEAGRILKAGGLVGFPTETVYGLGANALDGKAVSDIFAAKGRPADNPLIVHVTTAQEAEAVCFLNETAEVLMDAFCPGPLTMLLPKKDCVPPQTNAGLPSVAVRLPSHPVARAMIRAAGVPIAAPSANTSGRPSPTTAAHVYQDLHGKLPLILDGGESSVGLESTVVDLTAEIPTIVRPGGVTPEMLLQVLPQVRVADSVMRPLRQGEKAISPGMMYKHYAPRGALTMVKGSPEHVSAYCRREERLAEEHGRKVRLLCFEEHLPLFGGENTVSLGSLAHPEEIAHWLFALLRAADDDKIEVLYSEVLPPTGVGLAIMNRLARAAAFRLVDADQEE